MTGNTTDEQLFFCTTRIEAVGDGSSRTSVGTGFIVSRPDGANGQYLFVVTARHVLEGFNKATISFVASKNSKPELGKRCEIKMEGVSHVTFFHPDKSVDVAIFPFVPVLQLLEKGGSRPFFRSIPEMIIPNAETERDLSAIQPVVFMGYPRGLRDEKHLLPVARRGFTATPYVVDFNGLPIFLIDAAVFGGSSGSPVIVLDQGVYPTRDGQMKFGRMLWLGLVSQAYFHTEEGVVQFKSMPSQETVPTYQTTQALSLGVVVKANAVSETIDAFLKKHPSPSQAESVT